MTNYDLVIYIWTARNDSEWNEITHPPRSIKLFRRWECLFITKFDFVITTLIIKRVTVSEIVTKSLSDRPSLIDFFFPGNFPDPQKQSLSELFLTVATLLQTLLIRILTCHWSVSSSTSTFHIQICQRSVVTWKLCATKWYELQYIRM